MDTFTIRDLREHTGDLVHGAEMGQLSLVTKHGRPIFLAVPFNQALLEAGLPVSIAVQLYQERLISTGKAARLANLPIESFLKILGNFEVSPIHTYTDQELTDELDHIDE